MSLDRLASSHVIQYWPVIMLYIGPETILPLTSAIAAVFGVLLMFWQKFVSMLKKIWRLVLRKQPNL